MSGKPPETEEQKLLREMLARLPQLIDEAAHEERQDGNDENARRIEQLRRQKFPQINQGRSAVASVLHRDIVR